MRVTLRSLVYIVESLRMLLFESARDGNFKTLRFLLAIGFSIDSTDRETGKSLLHYAVEGRNKRVVLYLLSRGVRKYPRDRQGNTPLHLAATWPDEDIAQQLYRSRADLMLGNHLGLTPIYLARQSQNYPLIRRFRNQSDSESKINTTIYLSSLVKQRLKKGLDIEQCFSCPISFEDLPNNPCHIKTSSRWWQIYDYAYLLRCNEDPFTRQPFSVQDIALLNKDQLVLFLKVFSKKYQPLSDLMRNIALETPDLDDQKTQQPSLAPSLQK